MNTNEIKQLYRNYGITLSTKNASCLSAFCKEYGIDPHKILCDALSCVSQTVVNLSWTLLRLELNSMSAPLEP